MTRYATVIKRGKFDSAHSNSGFPEGHKCRNVHGHEFRYEIHVRSPIDEKTGLSLDFGEIKRFMRPLEDRFDHANLNELSFFKERNPTAENIAYTIMEHMILAIPSMNLSDFQKERTKIKKVILQETRDSSVEVAEDDIEFDEDVFYYGK